MIRQHVLKDRSFCPTGFNLPATVFPAKYSSHPPGRIPGVVPSASDGFGEAVPGRVSSPGTRPVNFVVESPMSVGSGRYCFKRAADFERGRKGGWGWWWSGKGTQPPLITAPQPSLRQDARSAGQRPHSRPGGRAPARLAFSGRPPGRGIPPAAGRASAGSSPALSLAASRSAARPLAPFPRCGL